MKGPCARGGCLPSLWPSGTASTLNGSLYWILADLCTVHAVLCAVHAVRSMNMPTEQGSGSAVSNVYVENSSR